METKENRSDGNENEYDNVRFSVSDGKIENVEGHRWLKDTGVSGSAEYNRNESRTESNDENGSANTHERDTFFTKDKLVSRNGITSITSFSETSDMSNRTRKSQKK